MGAFWLMHSAHSLYVLIVRCSVTFFFDSWFAEFNRNINLKFLLHNYWYRESLEQKNRQKINIWARTIELGYVYNWRPFMHACLCFISNFIDLFLWHRKTKEIHLRTSLKYWNNEISIWYVIQTQENNLLKSFPSVALSMCVKYSFWKGYLCTSIKPIETLLKTKFPRNFRDIQQIRIKFLDLHYTYVNGITRYKIYYSAGWGHTEV